MAALTVLSVALAACAGETRTPEANAAATARVAIFPTDLRSGDVGLKLLSIRRAAWSGPHALKLLAWPWRTRLNRRTAVTGRGSVEEGEALDG
ncbi:hypothetical protein GCM10009733_051070 [Nonomuraea maheshkhaliensis]|uniref:Uncharacterized protein n=1 Tax=Nonomuraea maheshkhaliensis TaxID=419590 RepID=A0ABP4RDW2_9ACTN